MGRVIFHNEDWDEFYSLSLPSLESSQDIYILDNDDYTDYDEEEEIALEEYEQLINNNLTQ